MTKKEKQIRLEKIKEINPNVIEKQNDDLVELASVYNLLNGHYFTTTSDIVRLYKIVNTITKSNAHSNVQCQTCRTACWNICQELYKYYIVEKNEYKK